MTPVIIDGKEIAGQIKAELLDRLRKIKQKGVTPGLAAVLVGNDPASAVYVRSKTRMCESLGLHSETYRLESTATESELLEVIEQLNQDSRIHGILIQLPLPPHLDPLRVFERIDPAKDVDGFTPVNRGRLQIGEETFVPCTPAGVQELMSRSGLSVHGKHVVILGRSGMVGLPLALLLLQKNSRANATVTVCHSATTGLQELTSRADVLIAAIGKPRFVTAEMVKDGVVVIDVGINRVAEPSSPKGYRLTGDVDFDSVKSKAGAITPVPGGVGPMTIIMLMRNTILAAERLTMRQ